MSDLICLIPSHGYADDTPVTVSWLGGVVHYVFDSDVATANKTFKLAVSVGGAVVQFTTSITDGFVREDSDTGVTTISGLEHLEGQLVSVTSGGNLIGGFTVSGGEITLTSELTTYQVGLPYTCKIRTTRLASPQAGNALQAQIKKINRTTVRHSKTQGGQIGQERMVRDEAGNLVMTEFLEDLEAVYDKDSRDIVSSVGGGVSTDAYTTIKSEVPSPMSIIATIVEFSIEEQR
jgi:hypothetical protein